MESALLATLETAGQAQCALCRLTAQLPHFLVTGPTASYHNLLQRFRMVPWESESVTTVLFLILPGLGIMCWEHTVRPKTRISVSDCNIATPRSRQHHEGAGFGEAGRVRCSSPPTRDREQLLMSQCSAVSMSSLCGVWTNSHR